MSIRMSDGENKTLQQSLKIDCEKCVGLCCVALFFSKTEGFPEDKIAGKPCVNLQTNFGCAIHKDLRMKGLKGCTAYDCFGAGQKVAQVTFKDQNWQTHPEMAKQMFDAFVVMRQLHEMLWYLTDAATFITNQAIKQKLAVLIAETEKLTYLSADDLLQINVEQHRQGVNHVLRAVNEMVQSNVRARQKRNAKQKQSLKAGYDFSGRNLTQTNLVGAHFAGALLIAAQLKNADLTGANVIGADLRDADLSGANLAEALFLTQTQVNAAKGDARTKLPKALSRPTYWEK